MCAEGEAVTKIDFVLVRGGVITGRITDSEGHPLIGERVNVLTKGASRQRTANAHAGFRTQHDGRSGNLSHLWFGGGKLHRQRGPGAAGAAVSIMGHVRQPFVKTFYPGVSEESRATIIEIKEGSEIKEVNISVGNPTRSLGFRARSRCRLRPGRAQRLHRSRHCY